MDALTPPRSIVPGLAIQSNEQFSPPNHLLQYIVLASPLYVSTTTPSMQCPLNIQETTIAKSNDFFPLRVMFERYEKLRLSHMDSGGRLIQSP